MATWTAAGSNRPKGDKRSYSNMFDNNDMTYWHGFMPAKENNKVLVSFHSNIMFQQLVFTARPYHIASQSRYQGVCLYLNNIKSMCTSTNRNTKPGDKIVLNPLNLGPMIKIKTVELRFPEVAVVAELQIHYKLQGTKTFS